MTYPGPLIPGTQIPASRPERTCTCGAATLCNLAACRKPEAVAYRKRVRPRWWEWILGPLLYLTRRWWA